MEQLSADEVRKIAKLCRLELNNEQADACRGEISAVLNYAQRLSELDLENVEPMAHVGDATNRLDADEPSPSLPVETVMKLAPQTMEPYISVPKVLGDGGA